VKYLATVFISSLLFGLIGLIYGLVTQGHSWILLPMAGSIYGLVFGCVFSYFLFFFKEGGRLSFALIVGVFSSAVPSTILYYLFSIELYYLVVFTLITGSVFGLLFPYVYNSIWKYK